MDEQLMHARQLIFNEATESEKVELRRKWLSGPLVAGTTRAGVVSITKGNEMTANSFFIEAIDDEREILEEAARTAQQTAEQARTRTIKANERELAKHFAKLVDGNVARVLNGELVFQLPNSNYFYSVTMENGNLLLSVDSTPVERFTANGDAVRALAKILAKNPQPKPAIAPVTEITNEQRLRDSIKRFVAALDELRGI